MDILRNYLIQIFEQILGQLEVFVGDELRDTIPILSSQQVERLSILGVSFS